MIKNIVKLSFLFIFLGISHQSWAYCLSNGNGNSCVQNQGQKWPTTPIYRSNGFSASSATFDMAYSQAVTTWSGLSNLTLTPTTGSSDPCINIDGVNGWGFSNTICGSVFGSTTLAVTTTQWYTNAPLVIVSGDIVFNSAVAWVMYTGPAAGSAIDFKRVAMHELGHSLGLKHSQVTPSLLNPYYSNTIETPQTDDINGLIALYGGSVNPPTTPPTTNPNIDIHGNVMSTATVINPTSSTSGRINISGDIDYFRINITDSGTLTLKSTGTTDVLGTLFDTEGTQIAQNDDGGVGFNFLIDRFQVSTGTYYVSVRKWGSGTGNYVLEATSITPNPTPQIPNDVTPPVINLLGSNPMTITLNASFTDPGSVVTDNVDNGLTATVTGSVNTALIGSYLLVYVASDAAGNAATPVIRAVNVIAAASGGGGFSLSVILILLSMGYFIRRKKSV